MKLFQPCWQRLVDVAVVSGCVTQAAAQSGVASAADPLQNEAAPMPSAPPTPSQGEMSGEATSPGPADMPGAHASPGEPAQPAAPAKSHTSLGSRIGGVASKLNPWHGKSAAHQPRASKSKTVMRHKPDSAPSAEAKASLRTKQFGAALQELRTAAEHGDVESEYLLGLVYASGVAPEVSLPEARRWLEAAAGKSKPGGRFGSLGSARGRFGADRAAAEEWLARAATEGQPTAIKLQAAHSLPLAPSRDAGGDTALARELLVWAIRHGDEKTLDAFIKVAGVENADEFGRTPLQYAVMSGSDVAVQHLLAAGADTAHADQFGVTPLMLAAEAESDTVLDELLKAGTDVNKKDSVGDTALFYGRSGRPHRSYPTLDLRWRIIRSVKRRRMDCRRRGLQGGTSGNGAIAEESGSHRAPEGFCDERGGGVDPTRGGELYQGWPPITIAASRNDARLVSELLAGGARADEPTPHRDTPLLVAAKHRAVAVIAPLLKAGANPAAFDEGW